MMGGYMAGSRQTLYEVIGVANDASPDEIRKAYRRKSLSVHPDKAPVGTSAEELEKLKVQFQDLSNAYNVLSDPAKRAPYNAWLSRNEPIIPPEYRTAQQDAEEKERVKTAAAEAEKAKQQQAAPPPPPPPQPQRQQQQRGAPPQPPPRPTAQDKPRAQSQQQAPRPQQPQGTARTASAPPKAASISKLDNIMMELFNTEKTFTNGLGRLGEAVAYMKNIDNQYKTASPATYDLLGKMANVADEIRGKYPKGLESVIQRVGNQYQFDHGKLQDYIKMVGKAFDLADKFNNPENTAEKDKVLNDVKANNLPSQHNTAFNQVPITPIQRLPRYELLFNEAMKAAPEDKAADYVNAHAFSKAINGHKNNKLDPDSFKNAMKDIAGLVNKLSDSSSTKEAYVKILRDIKKDFENGQFNTAIPRVEKMSAVAASNISKNANRKFYSESTRELHKQIGHKLGKIVEGYNNPINRQSFESVNKPNNSTTANMMNAINKNPQSWRVSASGKQRSQKEMVLRRDNPAVNFLKLAHTNLNNAIKEGKKGNVNQKKMQSLLDQVQQQLHTAQDLNQKYKGGGATQQRERTQVIIDKLAKKMNEQMEGLKMLNSPQAPTPPPTGRRMGR